MRASTLLLLTVAVLVGLGVAVAAKLSGYFNRPQPQTVTPPEIQVLVAGRNIFAGDLIDGSWVQSRALRPDELLKYRQDPKQFLPPNPNAAALRVANRHIEADQPILRDDLQEFSKPEPLQERLLPEMRALNIATSKDRCAGGLIQIGEWVDIHLTTTIDVPGGEEEITRTAPVATGVRVIAKRNALWNIFAPLPEDEDVNFTLEVNPYRAALVEFSKTKGYLSLVPVSAPEAVELEKRRTLLLQANSGTVDAALLRVGYQDEEDAERVQLIKEGDLTVGNDDLMRIFNLTTPPPPIAEVAIDQFSGTAYDGAKVFTADGFLVSDQRRGASRGQGASTSFQFNPPKCETCEKANQR